MAFPIAAFQRIAMIHRSMTMDLHRSLTLAGVRRHRKAFSSLMQQQILQRQSSVSTEFYSSQKELDSGTSDVHIDFEILMHGDAFEHVCPSGIGFPDKT